MVAEGGSSGRGITPTTGAPKSSPHRSNSVKRQDQVERTTSPTTVTASADVKRDRAPTSVVRKRKLEPEDEEDPTRSVTDKTSPSSSTEEMALSETSASALGHGNSSAAQIPFAAMVASSAKDAKRLKPDAPKFLLMLYEILRVESDRVIRWSEDGLALQILDQNTVTEKVLPRYFNHTNFHSFQRQLNYFGFRKWTKSKTDICTFSHPYFRRNQPELLQLIKRKKAPRRNPTGDKVDSSVNPVSATNDDATTVNNPLNAASGFLSTLNGGGDKRLLPLSPNSKRKLQHATGANSHGVFGAASHLLPQLHSSLLPLQLSNSMSSPSQPLHQGVSAMAAQYIGQPMGTKSTSNSNVVSPLAIRHKMSSSGQELHSFVPSDVASAASTLMSELHSTVSAGEGIGQVREPQLTVPDRSSPTRRHVGLPNFEVVRSRHVNRPHEPDAYHSGDQVSSALTETASALPLAQGARGSSHVPSNGIAQLDGETRPTNINTSLPFATQAVGESSPLFSNSFSDPVDILLRIKKSRAMSSDCTNLQSPQPSQEQSEDIASLQNFLLSQSLYTNRLESQLKLALEENDSLRSLVDAKLREVEALHNERKLLQNEKAVLLEDKNKLFEINRGLLSKLFPQ
ncbi:hypothetical protein PINS_up006191 [Pythium insidiosum]|nr:hypothetical protein PINS_up006191 [Pythium insidiosum]